MYFSSQTLFFLKTNFKMRNTPGSLPKNGRRSTLHGEVETCSCLYDRYCGVLEKTGRAHLLCTARPHSLQRKSYTQTIPPTRMTNTKKSAYVRED